MTKEELAALLNGREYGNEITREESEQAKESGLLVIYGASDDLIEFEGVFYDEAGAPGSLLIDDKGMIGRPDKDEYFHEDEYDEAHAAYMARKAKAKNIKAVWCPEDGEGKVIASWVYETDTPHVTFDIMEDGDLFCRGIVIHIDDLK